MSGAGRSQSKPLQSLTATTSPSTPNSTSASVSTKADLQSTSRTALSRISQTVSTVRSALSSETDPARLSQLHALLKQAQQALDDSKVEQMFAKASPKQLRAIEGYFKEDEHGKRVHDIVAFLGANRSGKSYCGAPCFCKDIRDNAPPDAEVLCVTVNTELSSKNQQKLVWDFLPKAGFGKWRWSGPKNGFGSDNPVIIYDERTDTNPDGRNITIHFKTQAQYENRLDSFEGLTIWKAWVDESVSAECWAAIRTRCATSDDAQVLITTIPNSEWFADFRRESKVDEHTFLIELMPEDNPIMTPEKIARFIRALPPHLRALRAEGKPLVEGATVYTEFDEARHVIRKADVPKDVCWYAGMDCGMDHPTVWLLIAVSKDGRLYVYDEYCDRNRTPDQDAKAILAMLGNRRLVWPTVADPAMWQNKKTGMEAIQYGKAGLTLMKAMRTSRFGEDFGVNRIKDMFACDELFVTEGCTNLISNLYKWKYKRDRFGNILESDRYEDKNNDSLDALRYVVTKNPIYRSEPGKFTSIDL